MRNGEKKLNEKKKIKIIIKRKFFLHDQQSKNKEQSTKKKGKYVL